METVQHDLSETTIKLFYFHNQMGKYAAIPSHTQPPK